MKRTCTTPLNFVKNKIIQNLKCNSNIRLNRNGLLVVILEMLYVPSSRNNLSLQISKMESSCP